jgi:hypothetical protein
MGKVVDEGVLETVELQRLEIVNEDDQDSGKDNRYSSDRLRMTTQVCASKNWLASSR